jgi:uncharacterized protein
MNKLVLILFLLFGFNGFSQEIPEVPNPQRLVNIIGGDNLLSADQIYSLEQKLIAYDDSTSTQVTLVIVKSVKPYAVNDFTQKLGEKWKVGQKGKNNGIVFLWATGDRKISIQTGYGMEGVLPDIYAERIINQIVIPNFKNKNYYEGLDQAIDQIYRYAAGEYDAEPESESILPFLIILLLLILFIWIASKNKNNRGGGRGLQDGSGWPYTTYTGWGRQSGNWGGGGSDWSGGGGGGSFGGFGGGSFGGGGASGDY